jgi:hypothetical protein
VGEAYRHRGVEPLSAVVQLVAIIPAGGLHDFDGPNIFAKSYVAHPTALGSNPKKSVLTRRGSYGLADYVSADREELFIFGLDRWQRRRIAKEIKHLRDVLWVLVAFNNLLLRHLGEGVTVMDTL